MALCTRNWLIKEPSLELRFERPRRLCYDPPAPAPRSPRPEVSVLARAAEWQCMLRRPGTTTRADLARTLDVSRAWITQGMAILDAPPQVLDAMRRRAHQVVAVARVQGLKERVRLPDERKGLAVVATKVTTLSESHIHSGKQGVPNHRL